MTIESTATSLSYENFGGRLEPVPLRVWFEVCALLQFFFFWGGVLDGCGFVFLLKMQFKQLRGILRINDLVDFQSSESVKI